MALQPSFKSLLRDLAALHEAQQEKLDNLIAENSALKGELGSVGKVNGVPAAPVSTNPVPDSMAAPHSSCRRVAARPPRCGARIAEQEEPSPHPNESHDSTARTSISGSISTDSICKNPSDSHQQHLQGAVSRRTFVKLNALQWLHGNWVDPGRRFFSGSEINISAETGWTFVQDKRDFSQEAEFDLITMDSSLVVLIEMRDDGTERSFNLTPGSSNKLRITFAPASLSWELVHPASLSQPTPKTMSRLGTGSEPVQIQGVLSVGLAAHARQFHDVGEFAAGEQLLAVIRSGSRIALIVASPTFETFSLGLVVLNAIWLGINADYEPERFTPGATICDIVEHVFCGLFVIELLARFVAQRIIHQSLLQFWFMFDTALVALTIFEIWLLPFLDLIAGNENRLGGPNVSVLRIVRLLRLTRVVRLIRLLRHTPELLCMLKGIYAAGRSIGCTLILLIGLVYPAAVTLRQLSRGTQFGAKYFPSVIESMYVLMLDAVLLDGTGNFLRDTRKESPVCAIVIALVILFASMMTLNILVGVMCEVVSNVSREEKDKITHADTRMKLEQMMTAAGLKNPEDNPKDIAITPDCLSDMLHRDGVFQLLDEVGVDPALLLEFADYLFQSDPMGMKFDKSVDFDEFVSFLMSIRGDINATVAHVMRLLAFVRQDNMNIKIMLKKLYDRLFEKDSRRNKVKFK